MCKPVYLQRRCKITKKWGLLPVPGSFFSHVMPNFLFSFSFAVPVPHPQSSPEPLYLSAALTFSGLSAPFLAENCLLCPSSPLFLNCWNFFSPFLPQEQLPALPAEQGLCSGGCTKHFPCTPGVCGIVGTLLGSVLGGFSFPWGFTSRRAGGMSSSPWRQL